MALKRSLAWMALAQGASFVLQFAASIVLARYLTPHEMGVYAVAVATVGVLSIVQAFGLQSLIVREVTLTPEISASAFSINCAIAVLLSGIIFGCAFLGASFLHEDGVRRTLLVLAVSPLIPIFEFLPAANLERRGRFKALSIIATVAGVSGTTCTIVLAMLGFKYMSAAYAQWVTLGVSAVLMNIAGREFVSFRVGFQAWRRVALFGLQMMTVSGITLIGARLSEIVLGRILGLSALGFLNRAVGLNGVIWNNIHLVVGRVIFVDYAELHRQGVSLRDRYLRTVEIITALLWPAFGGFAILAGPFILTVYGERWLAAAPLVALLSIASMVQVAITMTWELYAATGRLAAQTRIEFIRTTLAFVVFLGGCFISLSAAVGARIVDAVFAVFLYRRDLDRMTDTALPDFVPIYLKSLALTVLAVGPAAALMAAYRLSPHVPLGYVFGSIAAGIGLWAMGLHVLKHPLMLEARLTWSRMRIGESPA